jgi:signal transduction histidine kinase
VLTRMSDAEEYLPEDETFVELVAEYVAKAVSALRMGTVLSRDAQDFVDRVTEELRGALASAVNMIDTVAAGEAGVLTAEAAHYLGSASADTTRLLATLDDLIAIAHLRPPHLRELESVPVGPLLRRAAAAYEGRARARGITLEVRDPDVPLVVKAVPDQMATLVGQLIDNALKFSESGGRVEVGAGMAEGMVRIAVSDTGIGFDNADAARMVDCFTRAITAEAARIPGMGIGLFLCNEIVKNHSGRLWLESRRDVGTQAYVALPPAPEPV